MSYVLHVAIATERGLRLASFVERTWREISLVFVEIKPLPFWVSWLLWNIPLELTQYSVTRTIANLNKSSFLKCRKDVQFSVEGNYKAFKRRWVMISSPELQHLGSALIQQHSQVVSLYFENTTKRRQFTVYDLTISPTPIIIVH